MEGTGILEAAGWAEAGVLWETWEKLRAGRVEVKVAGMCQAILPVDWVGWWLVVVRLSGGGGEGVVRW